MPLIGGSLLLQRFKEHLRQATHVDIAVAWARPCDAVEALKVSAENSKIRIAVGLSNNFTYPTTLHRLREFADLRIAPPPRHGIFHPKYYCFHAPERTICWVGSANLTNGGFSGNNELIHEFEVKSEEDLEWFKLLWENLEPDPTQAIRDYERNYISPSRPPKPKSREIDSKTKLPSLSDIETWTDFISGLQKLDDYCHDHDYHWDIFGETHSYLHTINVGREVVRLSNWKDLSLRECHILRGYNRKIHEGDWGLLGTLPMGGTPYVFNPINMPEVGPIREQIREQIDRVLNANSSEISNVAQNAMNKITNMQLKNPKHHIGLASATRWLTLARPDCLLSINSKSSRKLGELSGLPKTPGSLANNYATLLNWVYDKPWFKSSQPNNSLEQNIWNCRTALLDAFVYIA